MTGTSQHVHSWYAATAHPHPAHPTLMGDIRCDVCVVGGGFTGLSAALNLAERGYSVVLLEAERIGWGASGRNGGQIVSGYQPGMSSLSQWTSKEDALRMWHMAEEAKDIIRDRVARHQIDCDLRWGYMLVANKKRHVHELAELKSEWESDYSYDKLSLLDTNAVRQRVASPNYCGGLHDAGGGHLHPLNYALGLANAAVQAGVRIFENSRVVRLEQGSAPKIHTAQGTVHSQYVVLSGGAYLNVERALSSRIMTIASYIVTTESLGADRAKALLPEDDAVTDMNFVLNYYRRTSDHRLLFGGAENYLGLDPEGHRAELGRRVVRVFPQLKDVKIEYVWGGLLDITMKRFPHMGWLSPNVIFAHGFSGQGVTLTGLTGKLMAEAISGTAERFDVLARIPHHTFPGGSMLRTPALVLAMMWYRLRDLL